MLVSQERLLRFGVRLIDKHSNFLSMEYLGTLIDKNGVHPTDSKNTATTEALDPQETSYKCILCSSKLLLQMYTYVII